MRRFTKLTLLLAMLIMASSDLYADPEFAAGSGSNSTRAGIGNSARGSYSSAFGYMNEATSSYSSAVGFKNKATAQNSSAFGYSNTAEGNNSSAFGNYSHASAANSTAIGYQATANVSNTVSFGHGIGDKDVFGNSYSNELNSKLVHVAAGIDDTDAVNYGQFKLAYTDASFDSDKSQLTLTTASGETNVIDIPTGSSLTEEQFAAANSGITSAKVTTYDTYITSTGLTAGDKKITNVLAGTADTDAVNYGQFKLAYTDASFDSDKSQLTLTTASGETNVIDIPTGSSLTEEQFAAANSGITSDKVATYDDKITTYDNKFTTYDGKFTTYDTYITSNGLTAGSKRITNVAAATEDTDAVNYGQMKQYVADNAGVSFSFGHRSARPAVNQYASADNNEIEAYRQENAELKNKVNTLENKNNELETRMKRLERLIVKMSKEEK